MIKEAGVSAVACLLEDGQLPRELLGAYRAVGLAVLRFPIPDFGVPEDPQAFAAFLSKLLGCLVRGERVYVHCYGGLGRTGTVLACLLKAVGEADPVAVTRRIYHPSALESEEQRHFVSVFIPGALGEGKRG